MSGCWQTLAVLFYFFHKLHWILNTEHKVAFQSNSLRFLALVFTVPGCCLWTQTCSFSKEWELFLKFGAEFIIVILHYFISEPGRLCFNNKKKKIDTWHNYKIRIFVIIKVNCLPWWLRLWRIHMQWRRAKFDPWVRKIPWRSKWQPTPVFLPGKSHGQRSLVGYSPRGLKE